MAAIIAFMFLKRNMTSLLVLVASTTIFGAASAINAPALGGASIPPPVFLLAFLVLRLSQSKDFLSYQMVGAFRDTAIFGVFVLYGLIGAYILPHAFVHQIEVVPTRFVSGDIYYTAPLAPSPQNITQSTYLVGTFVMLLATVFVCRVERRSRQVALGMVYLAWAQIGFGVVDVLASASHLPLLDWLRNANYAIVDQQVGGFHRIQGTFAETSAFSAWGFFLLVFITELWMRGIEPKLTGMTALGLGFILFASTSTSAYIGIAVYSLILGARIVYFPSTSAQRKGLLMAVLALVVVMCVLSLAVLFPAAAKNISGVLLQMTAGKVGSESALQRGFWNQKAWECFTFSKGLGVGVGTFRASSLAAALAGSTGIIGIVCFVTFCARLLPFHRTSTYRLDVDKTQAVGMAAAWAAVVGLAPALASASTADPGLMFAFLSGLAIAWAPHAPQVSPRGALSPRAA
jgi:hypothetical protein